jgi:GWxTD domain-containing protein
VSDPQGEVRSIYDAVVSGATAKISYELSLTDWADGCYQIRLIRPDGVEAIDSFKVSAPFWVSDASYLLKVNQLQYIATPEEMARLKSAPVSERDSLWQEFWRARDPTPNTELNEAEDEYFERIAYCEEHFGNPDRGYLSDRARVYMRLGAPDEVESHPFEIDRWPYEIWYYYNRSQRFVFVDQQGFGVYILVSPANF